MQKFRLTAFTSMVITLFVTHVDGAHGQSATRPFLSLVDAERGARACLDLAGEKKWRVAIAIKDWGGNLVYLARMDDVFVRQVAYAQLKANSAATTPVSTKKLGELLKAKDTPLKGLELIEGVTTVEGGEPIKLTSGYAIGAVGVSGAKPAQDGECARAAANKIAKIIN